MSHLRMADNLQEGLHHGMVEAGAITVQGKGLGSRALVHSAHLRLQARRRSSCFASWRLQQGGGQSWVSDVAVIVRFQHVGVPALMAVMRDMCHLCHDAGGVCP